MLAARQQSAERCGDGNSAAAVLEVALGLVGTDFTPAALALPLAFPRPAKAINFVVVAMGVTGVAEIVRRTIAPILRGTALGSLAGHPTGRRRAAGLVCRLCHRKEGVAAWSRVRQGGDRGHRRAGIGKQCRGADLFYSDAELGHSLQIPSWP
jgi:hypothetical protein